MTKIAHIIGARPQFIKGSPLIRELSGRKKIKNIIIHSGQHYDHMMSRVFFDELEIPAPQYDLHIGSAEHCLQIGKMMEGMGPILQKERPDLVLVYGDTNTTIAGALTAAKLRIPLAHLESGLRSYNREMPEELNRVLTDHASDILFCPSKEAIKNLSREGLKDRANGIRIFNVGDLMYDVLKQALRNSRSNILERTGVTKGKYAVLTLHRTENTANESHLRQLLVFASAAEASIIFPVHPRTLKLIRKWKIKLPENIKAIEPLGYFDMIWLTKNSSLVLTDSGGLQKEAYWLGIPCVTMREETEWLETVKDGWNILLKNYKGQPFRKGTKDAYGKGDAADMIANIIENMVNKG